MSEVNYNDGKWHGWNGGECPVHRDSMVEYVWHGSEGLVAGSGIAKYIKWDGAANKYFLSSFRVIKEHREPREWWIKPDSGVVCQIHKIGYIHVREVIE